MFYELRTYNMKPGSVAQWEANFGEALPDRLKHSSLGAFWHTDIGPLNQVIHVWPYESLDERIQVRAAALKEPGWPPKGRELILSQEAEIVIPSPFMKPLGERVLGPVYEMRIYTIQPGGMPEMLERWAEGIPHREKYSPLAASWYTDLGGLNKFYHIWAYKSFEERDRVRAESFKDPNWPPKTTPGLVVKMENKIMAPAAFSPMQ